MRALSVSSLRHFTLSQFLRLSVIALTLSACTKADITSSSAGSTLSGPTFSGATTTVKSISRLDADTSVTVVGSCDARMRLLEASFNDGASWTPLTSLSGSEGDCGDLQFILKFDRSLIITDVDTDQQKMV